MKIRDKTGRRQCFILFCVLFASTIAGEVSHAQIPDGTLFRRVSRASNFEFAIYNNGMLFGDFSYEPWRPLGLFGPQLGHWPRGSFHLHGWNISGLMILAKKQGKLLASDAAFMRPVTYAHGPFDHMVPGRIGDPKAGYDTVHNGAGWRYVDDPDYIVYSSLDYDSSGTDVSGSNFNDWPIRLVNGKKTYIADPLDRRLYPPVYLSDEDMFCVFKDTDTRADRDYAGPNGPTTPNTNGPIGLEVHDYVYTWASSPATDIVLFQYEIINKSGVLLDSCFVVLGTGLSHVGSAPGGVLSHKIESYSEEPWRNLTYVKPTNPGQWEANWTATPIPPTIGYPLLETPKGYDGSLVGLTRGMSWDTVSHYVDFAGELQPLSWIGTDSIIYRNITNPPPWLHTTYTPTYEYLFGPVLLSGPFQIAIDETVRTSVAYVFSDSLEHLLLLDDFIKRVYNSGFQRPSPPSAPRLTAVGLNRAVKLSWDNSAESAVDIIIPDSLGEPFVGYRLLRSQSEEGPYVEIGRWTKDSLLVYEYLDRGEDLPDGSPERRGRAGIGGLKNNVRYYYQLLSFDEGAVRLKLDPMESEAVEGVNSVSVVPTTEPANATSAGSDGSLVAGTLGDVGVPTLVPRNTTNFNNLVSGRTIKMQIDAVTNGIRYTLPVTIRDTVAGRVHNAIIDPDLFVHGSPETAGIKERTAVIENVFGIGAADVEIGYRFEQLAEPFHVIPTIKTQTGADVPIIIEDSLSVTGLELITPYTNAAQEIIMVFTPGGIDTGSTIFMRYFPYLNMRVIDVATGSDYTGEWTLDPRGIRRNGGITFGGRDNRYYLTGQISNGEEWDFSSLLSIYNWNIAFDYPDRGKGSGKPSPNFAWASQHRAGTRDFQAGDSVRIKWQGGVRAVFPQRAVVRLEGAPPGRAEVTDEMMGGIRIVPNPYLIRHEAQRGEPRIYFNYLPEECTIRIYTLALDLVTTLQHSGGSREEWDLQTEGGQLVASQMLIAHIEAPNGRETVKKFAVVVGR